jgi:hypothetical protein
MEANDQTHAPAAWPPENKPSGPTEQEAGKFLKDELY